MQEELPNQFTAKTSFGVFQIKITNRRYISIGSKNNCVQIGYNVSTNEGMLDWLGTEKGGCEHNDKIIHGMDTIAMVDLGFTILQKLYPDIKKWIKLRDSSKFNCTLPDGNGVPISNMIYNLLLHGETYYQKQFKAVPLYEEAIPGSTLFYKFWNSEPLPDTYSFNNDDLIDILIPIYKKSHTWREFFQEIYKKYGRKTCTIIHSWYLDVYSTLAKIPITTDWKIDITTRPIIDFTILNKNNNRNYTRKSFIYDPYNFSGGYYPSFIKYKEYIKRNIKTQKFPIHYNSL